jgi:hypothetical protein
MRVAFFTETFNDVSIIGMQKLRSGGWYNKPYIKKIRSLDICLILLNSVWKQKIVN